MDSRGRSAGEDTLQERVVAGASAAQHVRAVVTDDERWRAVNRLLNSLRQRLRMDVAFVSQFVDDERVFRYVDAGDGDLTVEVGASDPLEETYCHYVARGSVPGFLADPSQHPVTSALPVTRELPVGTHLSVPIQFRDGRIFGTLCCFSYQVTPWVQERDLHTVRVLADIAAEYLEEYDEAEEQRRQRRRLIEEVLTEPGGIRMDFQPLIELTSMRLVGVEALARFPGHTKGPEWFFREAAEAGLGLELEMKAVRAALGAFPEIPEPVRLNINVSPSTLCTEQFFEAVTAVPGERLTIEVTEHAAIDDYAEMRAASQRLTKRGMWLAIDDVGMGFSGLNRILESEPEELKLDRAVIRGADRDPVRQALIEAMCSFGQRVGFAVLAEGIETQAELEAVRRLGASIGQGFYLGRPGPLAEALRA